jgi:hypothetical protein
MKLFPDRLKALAKLHDAGYMECESLQVKPPAGASMGRLQEQLGTMEASIKELSSGLRLEESLANLQPKVQDSLKARDSLEARARARFEGESRFQSSYLQSLMMQDKVLPTSRDESNFGATASLSDVRHCLYRVDGESGQINISSEIGHESDSVVERKEDLLEDDKKISELYYEAFESPTKARLELRTPSEAGAFHSPLADSSRELQSKEVETPEVPSEKHALQSASPTSQLPHFAFVCARLSQLEFAKAEQARQLDSMKEELQHPIAGVHAHREQRELEEC